MKFLTNGFWRNIWTTRASVSPVSKHEKTMYENTSICYYLKLRAPASLVLYWYSLEAISLTAASESLLRVPFPIGCQSRPVFPRAPSWALLCSSFTSTICRTTHKMAPNWLSSLMIQNYIRLSNLQIQTIFSNLTLTICTNGTLTGPCTCHSIFKIAKLCTSQEKQNCSIPSTDPTISAASLWNVFILYLT